MSKKAAQIGLLTAALAGCGAPEAQKQEIQPTPIATQAVPTKTVEVKPKPTPGVIQMPSIEEQAFPELKKLGLSAKSKDDVKLTDSVKTTVENYSEYGFNLDSLQKIYDVIDQVRNQRQAVSFTYEGAARTISYPPRKLLNIMSLFFISALAVKCCLICGVISI